jgi:hypothetical protein
MSDEKNSSAHEHHNRNAVHGGGGSAVYGMGLIGAAVYFIQHSATFWAGVLGILKAIIWPAMLVYKLLEYLKM